jgi:hypothetical protein
MDQAHIFINEFIHSQFNVIFLILSEVVKKDGDWALLSNIGKNPILFGPTSQKMGSASIDWTQQSRIFT